MFLVSENFSNRTPYKETDIWKQIKINLYLL